VGRFAYRVSATYESGTARSADSHTVTVADPIATSFAVSAPSTATAGTGLTVTVTATTASHATATEYTGTAHLTSSDTQAVLPADYAFTGADNGTHTFAPLASGATLTTKGSRTIVATDASSGITGSFSVSVGAAAPVSVTATAGTPQAATVGTAFPAVLVATVTDAYANEVPGVSVVFIAPASGASGTFAPSATTTTAVTNAKGVATATALTASTTAGSFAVSAAVFGASSGTFSLTNRPGPGSELTTHAGDHQAAPVNATFATALAARVTDAFGNPRSGVSVVFTAPASGASGTFANDTATTSATTNARGIATATDFTAGTTAGSYRVAATVSGATAGSFALTNTYGTAATVTALDGSSQSAGVSLVFGARLRAKVTDSFGNGVAGVSVQFTAPARGATGRFAPSSTATTSATTNASGVATAAAFTASTRAGSYAVSATASGATPGTFALTNTPGTASVMRFVGCSVPASNAGCTGQPIAVGNNSDLTASVYLTDAFGNAAAPSSPVRITITVSGATFSIAAGSSVTVTSPSSRSTRFTVHHGVGSGTGTVTAHATSGRFADLRMTVTK
jgi:hypothetical protein